VTSVAWTGDTLASSSLDKSIFIWSIKTMSVLHTLKGHTEGVSCVAWNADGTKLASASLDKTLRIWGPNFATQSLRLHGHFEAVLAVAFSPSGEMVVSSCSDKTGRVWNASTGAIISTLQGTAMYCKWDVVLYMMHTSILLSPICARMPLVII
jgi:WD40 repeat protein